MSQPLIVRSDAGVDIREAFNYLEEVRTGLGDLFSARLREVFESIEANPLSCGVIWQDVRTVRTKKFQYVIYYLPLADRVEILAVLHGSRSEEAWRSRLGE